MIEEIRKTGFCSFSTEEKLSPQDFVFSFKEKESKDESLTIRDIEVEREKLLEELESKIDNFEIEFKEEEKLSEAEGEEPKIEFRLARIIEEDIIPFVPTHKSFGDNKERESVRDASKNLTKMSLDEDIRPRCSIGGYNNSKNNKEAKKFVRDVYEKSKEINLEDREFVDEFFLFVKRESERIVMSQNLLEKDLD